MIYPIQTILPLCFPEDTQDVVKEDIPDLGPLHLHLCKGIEFTSKHQLPIVKPNHIVPPEEITTLSRLKNVASNKKKRLFAHFYTADKNFEKVWNRPFSYIKTFKSLAGIISTDYSILTNMVESQRQWNDFRNKLLAAFYQRYGVSVIASPSWSDDLHNIERYMEGWPRESVIAINSTGVCHDKRAKKTCLDGYWAMYNILHPTHILRYGGFIEGEMADISTYYVNNNRV